MGIILDADTSDEVSEEFREKFQSKAVDDEYNGQQHVLDDVYIHEKELELLKEKYSHSIVQDFGDMYHTSKEERERAESEYAKIFKLRNMRSSCPRISEYVKQWRLILEVVREIAKNNKLIPEDEFIEKFMKKKIYINGVTFPKYVGKKKKHINWSYIIEEYIMKTDKDPAELDLLTHDTYDSDPDDFTEEDIMSDPLIRGIVESYHEDEDKLIKAIESGKEEYGVVVSPDISLKKIRKMYPELVREIRDANKLNRQRERVRGTIADIEDDDYEYISKYDKRFNNTEKVPKFKGDWDNKDDIDMYLHKLDEYMESTEYIQYNNRYYTKEEYEELELKQLLEQNNWNLRNCFVDKEAEKALKKQRKADRAKEKKIKEMLKAISERKEATDKKLGGIPEGINIDEVKKNLSKKKRKKKKGKKKDKALKKTKKTSSIIFDANDDPEYKDKMEDWRWDYK